MRVWPDIRVSVIHRLEMVGKEVKTGCAVLEVEARSPSGHEANIKVNLNLAQVGALRDALNEIENDWATPNVILWEDTNHPEGEYSIVPPYETAFVSVQTDAQPTNTESTSDQSPTEIESDHVDRSLEE